MAGIDSANQFPNSRMAQAAKLGQSRFTSIDVQDRVQLASQKELDITTVKSLTVPAASASSPGNWMPPTYAVITAIGGTMYVTYDGTVPSSTNYVIAVAQGSSLPVPNADTMAKIKIQGTTASISYWS